MTWVRALAQTHWRALALELSEAPELPRSLPPALVGAHLLALLAVARLAHWPLWAAPAIVAIGCLPSLARRRWLPEVFAPFVLLYVVAAVRLLLVNGLREAAPPTL